MSKEYKTPNVSAILRKMKEDGVKVSGCSYGCHSWVRGEEMIHDMRTMVCVACGGIYLAREEQWQMLSPRKGEEV